MLGILEKYGWEKVEVVGILFFLHPIFLDFLNKDFYLCLTH